MADTDASTAEVVHVGAQAVGFQPTDDNIELLKKTLGDITLQDNELQLFLYQAQRTGLDPLARQIYALKKGRVTFMVSIDGQRLVAQRTGEYQGQLGPQWCGKDGVWRDVWLEDENPAAARVGVYRTGFKQPLMGVATWKSYGRDVAIWREKADVMLAKCAEALALRKAFPQELSGLYTDEEMPPAEPPSRMSISDAIRQASELLGQGGIDGRAAKLAIIFGIAEVQSVQQLTGHKMKVVLDTIKSEAPDDLRLLYVDTIKSEAPEAEVVQQTDKSIVDEYAESQAAVKQLPPTRQSEPDKTWVIPEFKPGRSGMALPAQHTLIKNWLPFYEQVRPGEAENLCLILTGNERPGTFDDAMTVIEHMADAMNEAEAASKKAS